MTVEQKVTEQELPAGLVIFGSDGRVQFGWKNPETGAYYAEIDGTIIADAIGAVSWHARRVH
jgi:hypothetical protein